MRPVISSVMSGHAFGVAAQVRPDAVVASGQPAQSGISSLTALFFGDAYKYSFGQPWESLSCTSELLRHTLS
jgi:hypothetical protein